MSKAEGSPLAQSWRSAGFSEPDLPHQQRASVVWQLGAITWQLSQLCFDQIGSIFEENGDYEIRTCLPRGLMIDERFSLDEVNRGPFATGDDYCEALFSVFSHNAKCLPLGHHCLLAPIPLPSEYSEHGDYRDATDRWNNFVAVGSKIDTSINRTDYVLAGNILAQSGSG